MKQVNNRIAAFTVIETMVALVLTALALSLIFTGIRFVNSQSETFTSHLAASGETDRLYHALQADANRAAEVRQFPGGLDFRKADTSVYYFATDSLFVRQTDHLADTFRIRIDSIAYWFLNRRQEGQSETVDECSIYVTGNQHAAPLLIRKTYDVATLMCL